MLDAGTGALAQEVARGSREAVIMFIADGEIHASFAYSALRTSPALGGASVLRETMPIPADLHDLSVRLVTAIGMQGLCEVEFRRDLAGLPLLMEVNARLVGGIETARRAGVDFPLMIWQWATGNPVDRVQSYRSGLRTRWLRGDMRWLMNNRGRAGRPDQHVAVQGRVDVRHRVPPDTALRLPGLPRSRPYPGRVPHDARVRPQERVVARPPSRYRASRSASRY